MKARRFAIGRARQLWCFVLLASAGCSLSVLDDLQGEERDGGGAPSSDHDAALPAHCEDGLTNEGESGPDCGGVTECDRCEAGEGCTNPSDCASVNCVGNVCAQASCADEIRNQGEQYVDCGGPCPACAPCSNGLKEPGEADIDCGHVCGVPCSTGSTCRPITAAEPHM